MRIELWNKNKLLVSVAVAEQPEQAAETVNTYEYGALTTNRLLKTLAHDVAKLKKTVQDSSAS